MTKIQFDGWDVLIVFMVAFGLGTLGALGFLITVAVVICVLIVVSMRSHHP